MKIDAFDEKSILVELSKDDLSKSEITYEQLDYSNEKTRNLVRSVLEKIRLETGRCVSDCASLEVDVMPDSFGGCLMIFKEKKQNRTEKSEETSAFKTNEINSLIDFSRRIKNEKSKIEKAELYALDGMFFLLAKKLTKEQKAVAAEYLKPLFLSEAKLLSIKEAGKCLIESRAIEVLAQ